MIMFVYNKLYILPFEKKIICQDYHKGFKYGIEYKFN